MDLEDLNLNKHKKIIEYYLKQENANIMPNKDLDHKYLKINFVERNDVVNVRFACLELFNHRKEYSF